MLKPDSVQWCFYLSKRYVSRCKGRKGNSCDFIKNILRNVANNYVALPVVLCRGKGVKVYDVEGKSYLDFLSGHGSVALGHSHPKICRVLCNQAWQLTQTSRSFFTRNLAEYGEYITKLLRYDKVLPMNSGNEASETAVKLARKWGYLVKRIEQNQAKIIFPERGAWGRSIAAISSSCDPLAYCNYGPFVPCFDTVPFNDPDALATKLKDPNVCAFMLEPILGEAGVVIPDPCYLKAVRELCTQHRVLMIADEVHTGLGRTGSLLCCDIYRVRPDVLVLGKALGGGLLPVSAVLADCDIMDVMEPGSHGSTFGGNALGCKVAVATLKIIQDEHLVENAKEMGEIFRGRLADLPKDVVCEVRGVGLLNALVLKEGISAEDLSIDLMNNGLLVRMPRFGVIHLCPPLVIKEKEIIKATQIIRKCIENSRGQCENGNGNGNGGGGGGSGVGGLTSKSGNNKFSKKFTTYADRAESFSKNLANSFKRLSPRSD